MFKFSGIVSVIARKTILLAPCALEDGDGVFRVPEDVQVLVGISLGVGSVGLVVDGGVKDLRGLYAVVDGI